MNIKTNTLLKSSTKILLIILVLLISSCNTVKRVKDNEYLLEKNTILVNNKKTLNTELYSYLIQRPNQKVLGLPVGLYIYNWANPNFEKTYKEWLKNHPKKAKRTSSLFSAKQTKAIYNFNKGFNKWLKKNGEAPVIIDNLKTKRSEKTLEKYFKNKGYFDVIVNSESKIIKEKRKKLLFNITSNKPYFLDTIQTEIKSKVLDSLYKLTSSNSLVKKGQQFDLENFKNEVNRLSTLYRNSGIYRFNKDYVKFDLDSTIERYTLKNIILKIANQSIKVGDSVITKPFVIQKIKNINIYTDYSFNTKNEPYLDSVNYKGYTFWAHKKLKYNPKYLANTLAITPYGVYKDKERKATRQYLNALKIFRTPINIEYIEKNDTDLETNIYLTPLKKYGIDANIDFIHSNIKPFGVLGKLSFLDRNIFKGLEIFDVSFQGSFLNLAEDTSDPEFNYFGFTAWEIGATASLKMPRIFFPLNTSKIIPKYMRPKTDISISTSFQKNIGLDRQNITAMMSYFWQNNNKVKHQLDLFNIQYINNLNPSSYFNIFNSELRKLYTVSQTIFDSNTMDNDGNITNPFGYMDYILNPVNNFESTNILEYQTVQRVKERNQIIAEDILVPAITYTFTYSNKENINDYNFSFFRSKIVSSGSITSAVVPNKKINDKKTLFDLPIAQYIKAEIEYKKYWDFGRNNHIVLRSFIGAAIPFGNSTDIPFSRKYRAGGSNDIRAWKTFDLGPGTSQSSLEFNTGNFKMVYNLEYRFKFFNNIYSALFIDAGNVWDLTNSELTSNNAKFKGLNSLKEIAVGSGFGIRYDFSFLIFRVDVGFKTYEPYLENKKWFQHYNFKNEIFNFGINYPF